MIWASREYELDDELRRRIERLQSGVEQAKRDIESLPVSEQGGRLNALDTLRGWLDEALLPNTRKSDRLSLVIRTEAELCLYQTKHTLIADHIRLKDRLYRFNEGEKAAWLEQLARFEKDKQYDDQEYRQLLRRLTFEIAEAAESYVRHAKDRSQALSIILGLGFLVLAVLIGFFVSELLQILEVTRCHPDQADYLRSFPKPLVLTLMIGGSLGAAITVVRSISFEEKAQRDYVPTLFLNLLIRIALGSVYAIAVIFALFANILPMQLNPERGLLMFLVVAAVAAGVSDKFFGKAISGVITGKQDKKPAKGGK